MEVSYIEMPGPPGQLIHFTPRLDTVASILREGFLYVHNETIVHGQLFQALGVTVPDIERGMVSFTVAEWDNSDRIRSVFGAFGIAVDFNWALDKGARAVAYLPSHGPLFEALKTLLQASMPTEEQFKAKLGAEANGLGGAAIKELLLSDPGLDGSFTTPLYHLLLELLHWVEADCHAYQHEYRIRIKHTFGGISKIPPRDQVPMLLSMKEAMGFDYSLKLGPEHVLYFCCPARFESEFRRVIEATHFRDKVINCYPS